MRTHASKPNNFGSWVIWDWVSSINSTCFSFNMIVSEHDTLIQEYRVGTWHSDPRIPCQNVTFRSKNIASERDTPIQDIISLSFSITTFPFVNNISSRLLYSRHYFDRDGLRLYISRSRDFRPITKHTTKPHNQVHIKLRNIIQCISVTIKSLLSNNINHNLPPPKNRSQATTSPMLFLSLLPPNPPTIKYIYIHKV